MCSAKENTTMKGIKRRKIDTCMQENNSLGTALVASELATTMTFISDLFQALDAGSANWVGEEAAGDVDWCVFRCSL